MCEGGGGGLRGGFVTRSARSYAHVPGIWEHQHNVKHMRSVSEGEIQRANARILGVLFECIN